MSAFQSISSWVGSWVEYFSPEEDNPNWDKLNYAKWNAMAVATYLDDLAYYADLYFPHHPDIPELSKQVLKALSDDSGGTPPHEVLQFWDDKRFRGVADRDIFATPEEKQAMMKVWERWNHREKLRKEFWGFHLPAEGTLYLYERPLTEKRMLEGERCLRKWLKEHRVGKTN